MNLTLYVDKLRRELLVAAEAGGEDARALAERLTAPLESAARLTLLEALSAAAQEITRDIAPGSVDVRLRGLDPSFVVTLPAEEQPAAEPDPGLLSEATPAPVEPEEGGTARVNLRLPEHLKTRIEEAAGKQQLSVNAWLVRTLTTALEPGRQEPPAARRGPRGGQHFTGWVS